MATHVLSPLTLTEYVTNIGYDKEQLKTEYC